MRPCISIRAHVRPSVSRCIWPFVGNMYILNPKCIWLRYVYLTFIHTFLHGIPHAFSLQGRITLFMQYLNIIKTRTRHPKVMRCYQSRQVGNGMDVMSSVGDVVLWKIMSCHPKLMWYYQSRQLGNGMDVMSCQGIISCIMLAWLKNGKFWENPFWDEISCQCPMTLLR